MNRIILFLLVGLVLAGGIALYVYNKPHRDVASEKPAHTLTANELFDAYEADETAANEIYLDNTVQVTGTAAEDGVVLSISTQGCSAAPFFRAAQ